MASPTSDLKKWYTLAQDDKSRDLIELSAIITDLGKSNADYALFAPEWFPAYGLHVLAGKMVDPDDLEPFVNAWIAWSAENRQSFTADKAKDAMKAAGLDPTRSYVVANAMWRLRQAGNMSVLLESPQAWADNQGVDPTDIAELLNQFAAQSKKALETSSDIITWLPWIAVGVAAFVAWPYIAGVRTLAPRKDGF